jgi:hypothetical protein
MTAMSVKASIAAVNDFSGIVAWKYECLAAAMMVH